MGQILDHVEGKIKLFGRAGYVRKAQMGRRTSGK